MSTLTTRLSPLRTTIVSTGSESLRFTSWCTMLAGMNLVPGHGIDFTALAHVLMMVLGLYVLAALLSYGQGFLLNGIVQR